MLSVDPLGSATADVRDKIVEVGIRDIDVAALGEIVEALLDLRSERGQPRGVFARALDAVQQCICQVLALDG